MAFMIAAIPRNGVIAGWIRVAILKHGNSTAGNIDDVKGNDRGHGKSNGQSDRFEHGIWPRIEEFEPLGECRQRDVGPDGPRRRHARCT